MQDKLVKSKVVGNCAHSRTAVGSAARGGIRGELNQKPEIHVQKQGERITSMMITCSCGEQINIVCEYAEDAP